MQAGATRHEVNYVNAHATLTQAGDLCEYKALKHSFRENPEVRLSKPRIVIAMFRLSSSR
jgi:3-oxoacyl-[acyl-carrier-protein] synthase II